MAGKRVGRFHCCWRRGGAVRETIVRLGEDTGWIGLVGESIMKYYSSLLLVTNKILLVIDA